MWQLDRLVAGLASQHPGLSVSGIVLEPTPAALFELVDAVEAAVLVVGPGRGNVLPSRGQCPVVVVNGRARRCESPRPVMVGVDAADTCVPALRFAFAFAHRDATAVRVVQAWSRRTPPAFGPDCPPEPMSPLVPALADVVTGFPDVPFELALAQGRPTRQLPARASDAALLVVGERYAPRRMRSLVRKAVCPVAIVPRA
ncbi:universal stress protein [Amycolatopsis sp. OK19-0408]|uniref:Universal stress protein n=1 Tax=Amycolatopsis iheyensis TaxID=2945988 RepID=A0A9X2NPI9_9PSEU|nr:universal stress protein [Amycolatopsis iheyensis]MCR6490562.1 universal stress protein [Amycolatopsis iheyensis]